MAATPNLLVLSLFPGIDLLGRAFRELGYCVVTGPDTILGGDVADFRGLTGRFNGVIAGTPCQDFSVQRRTAPTGQGVTSLRHFLRVVNECQPGWFLLENVPAVPDVRLDGYAVQRFGLTDAECGGVQLRRRHFQFGHRFGWIVRPDRCDSAPSHPAVMATDAGRSKRSYPLHCRLMGLVTPPRLSGWSRAAKFRAVGNGVPMAMGHCVARGILAAGPRNAMDCICGCGRPVTPPASHATAACRKRMERRRRGRVIVDL